MQTQSKSNVLFGDRLQGTVGQLVERAAATPAGAERSRLLRWLVLAGVLFLAWRFMRGFRKLFWAMFGIAMAFWWSGGALWFFSR